MGLVTWTLILVLAASVIWYGARRGLHLIETFAESVEVIEQNSMKMWTAILLPVFGSLMLVLLFFFLDKLSYLLIGLMTISSLIGIAFVFLPLFDILLKKCHLHKEWNVKYLGTISTGAIVSFLFAVTCVGLWLGTSHWVMVDFLAVCLAITAIAFIRLPNLKIALILLGLFFVYDIFWVFLSEFLFGESVMEKVAVNLPDLPMLIILPEISALEPFHSIRGYSLLGVGDIVLPGLLLAFLYRFDDYQCNAGIQPTGRFAQVLTGYFWRGMLLYILGLITTILVVYLMKRGQPALLYLVPFTIGVTIVTSLYRKEFKVLFRGIPHIPVNPSSDTAVLLNNEPEEEVKEKE